MWLEKARVAQVLAAKQERESERNRNGQARDVMNRPATPAEEETKARVLKLVEILEEAGEEGMPLPEARKQLGLRYGNNDSRFRSVLDTGALYFPIWEDEGMVGILERRKHG
jgi:hypothetical protein